MSYQSAIDQLSAMVPELYTLPGQPRRKFSLPEFGILLAAVGHPQNAFPAVLIAGTNGKGSTAATLASILSASGLRTGLYTSPHLSRPNERIRINGEEIPDHSFATLFSFVYETAKELVLEGSSLAPSPGAPTLKLAQLPSFFETLTAMAFLHFAASRVQIAVLEVGMGGRLDATNIVNPLLSIVTDISLDHMEWLGSTIAEIAREKAGILRRNRALITLPQHPDANRVLGEVAAELDVRGVSAVPYMPATAAEESAGPYTVDVLGAPIQVDSPLHGAHQRRNVALAIAAAAELATAYSFPVTSASIAEGIRQTRWPARLEHIVTRIVTRIGTHDAPHQATTNWILDVAHNPAGAWALRAGLRNLLHSGEPGAKPATLIFSCLRDKPLKEMAQILFPLFDRVVFAPIASSRATPMADMLAAAEATATPAQAADSVAHALDLAKGTGNLSGRDENLEGYGLQPVHNSAPENEGALAPASTIVISGSVYLVGEARSILLREVEPQ